MIYARLETVLRILFTNARTSKPYTAADEEFSSTVRGKKLGTVTAAKFRVNLLYDQQVRVSLHKTRICQFKKHLTKAEKAK